MSASAIEWTDETWNPVRGCVKVSPGCAHCYAETFAERFRGVRGHPYEHGFDLRLVPAKLEEPLRWKKPRRVFVNSMSDLFQDGVPDEYIDRVFAVMALAPQHTFQVLTKRAARMRAYMAALDEQWEERLEVAIGSFLDGDWVHGAGKSLRGLFEDGISALLGVEIGADNEEIQSEREIPWPLPNVWLGVSVENQHFADERIPLLLQTPAAVRFISAEPLLGSVNLREYLDGREDHGTPFSDPPARTVGGCIGWTPGLDWVIVGGESGHGARPFDLAWARAIVQQCQAAGVACFVKQLGAKPVRRCELCPPSFPSQCRMFGGDEVGHLHDGMLAVHLKDRKGGDMSEWPEDLRIREFPSVQPLGDR